MGVIGAATAWLVWVAAMAAPSTDQAATQERIAAAIAGFEPCWSPPAAGLRGLVVALDPLGGGGLPGAADDLALMTAAHLHHLVRSAAGDTVLIRRDARPPGGNPAARQAAVLEMCSNGQAHLLLTIGGTGETAPEPAGAGDGPAWRIARCIADHGAGLLRARAGRDDPPEVIVTLTASPADPGVWPAERRHQQCAEAICRGLLEISAGDRAALEAGGRRRAGESVPVDRFNHDYDRRVRMDIARAARQIRPEGELPPERAEWFVSALAGALVGLNTALVYEPRVEIRDRAVVLDGCTTAGPMLETAAWALEAVGLKPAGGSLRLLPDRARLGERIFGVCRDTTVLGLAEPSPAARAQTQLMWGEPVFLLDCRDGWLRLLSTDGYAAWVPQEAIERLDEAAFDARLALPWATAAEDLRPAGARVLRGTRLALVSCDAGRVTTLTPAGEPVELPASAVRPEYGADQGPARAAAALDMLHVPYVFGAQSPVGLDCSGLVANVWLRHGVHLPRDAAQQALGGRLVATSWHRGAIRAGDRLYFINAAGKVFHTGIALSATHFVHSSPPGVKINSLRPGDRLYAADWDRTFFIARRP